MTATTARRAGDPLLVIDAKPGERQVRLCDIHQALAII
jgi:hypothetical protein